MTPNRRRVLFLVLLAGSGLLYGVLVYLVERHESVVLLPLFAVIFAAFLGMCRLSREEGLWPLAMMGAVFLRVILLLHVPSLSDDYFRFLWDGHLLLQGINPFAHLPREIVEGGAGAIAFDGRLFEGMNSPDYYTIYPTVCQVLFAAAAFASRGSILGGVIALRCLFLLAELRTMVLLVRLVKEWGLPRASVLLYALNPLVILELTGNLHFEAIMIALLLEAVWRLRKGSPVLGGMFFGLAVATKVLPLMLLPLFQRYTPRREGWTFLAAALSFSLLALAPLFGSAFVRGFGSSAALYFQLFEFNASVHAIAREIGWRVLEENPIRVTGRLMAALTFAGIMVLSLARRRSLDGVPGAMVLVWFLYLALATTVHPWYITPLIALAPMTRYRFPVVWSAAAFVTYAGYDAAGYALSPWFFVAEYAAVYGFIAHELVSPKPGSRP